MSRIRTIKPEFWTSEQIVECSPIARLLFIGIWNFCDDYGNHPFSLRSLKMRIFPGDDITLERMQELFDELLRSRLIALYSHGESQYFHVIGWRHQKIDKPSRKFPEPTAFDDHSPNVRRPFDDHSLVEGNGREADAEGNRSEHDLLSFNSTKKFEKPNAEQVKGYAIERSSPNFDVEAFFDHYESNGWMIGKVAMKDWRAAVRKWIKNLGTSTGKTPVSQSEAETALIKIVEGLRRFDFETDCRGLRGFIGESAWTAASSFGWQRILNRNEFTEKQIRADFIAGWGRAT